MPREYLTDGDPGFVGVNSRDNPYTLQKGTLTLSENFRLNRGIASVRKGLKRMFSRDLEGPSIDFRKYELNPDGSPNFSQPILDYQARDPETGLPLFDENGDPVINEVQATDPVTGEPLEDAEGNPVMVPVGVFVYGPPGYPDLDASGNPIIRSDGLRYVTTCKTSSGDDLVVFICESKLFTFNTATNALSANVDYPAGQTISATDPVDAFQAGGDMYILRGYNKRPLKWTLSYAIGSVSALPVAGHEFPNSKIGMYQDNRIIVQNSSDSIAVSHYLDPTNFNMLDVFRINDGSNDEIVAVAPWVLNEGVVFMKHRIYYVSVGVGAYQAGDQVIAEDCYVKTLATDIGCVARKTIIQAAGGIFFLSDHGVYQIAIQQATTPEGMRAGVLGEPISAPIEDKMEEINQSAVHNACAIYHDNRYYIAVPVGNSVRNNRVFVYNIVNKSWESVDRWDDPNMKGFAVDFMVTGIYKNRRRLFFVDRAKGLFLTEEEGLGDEFENTSKNPFLPVWLPFYLSSYSFTKFPINGRLETRVYSFNSLDDKRFTSAEVDIVCPEGAFAEIKIKTENPEVEISVDKYGSDKNSDSSRDFPIRKTATAAKIRVESTNGRPTIRSCMIQAIDPGNNTISRK